MPDENFRLNWKKRWSDAVDDFTGRDPDDHFSFCDARRDRPRA